MREDDSSGQQDHSLALVLRALLIVALGLFFVIVVVTGVWLAPKFLPSLARTSSHTNSAAVENQSPETLAASRTRPVSPTSNGGALDETFHRTGRSGEIIDMLVQSDGQILVSGLYDEVEGEPHKSIARFNDDGTLERSFTAGAGGSVHAMSLQPDGQLILAGDFGAVNGTRRKQVARVTTTGQLDDSFSIGTGGDKEVRAVTVQRDGKILVGGNFSRFNGETHRFIVRLNADGSIDPAFVASAGATVWQIIEQPDGRILLRGNFKQINGSAHYSLVRLERNGRVDHSFAPDRFDTVRAIALQPDGKILVASSGSIFRLNTDGSLDKTFEGSFGAGDQINHIAVDRRGRALVAGRFNEYAGWGSHNIVRFDGAGSVDKTFQCEHDFDKPVRRLAFTSNDDVLAAGNFTERLLRFRGGSP